jgi:hypothetical protein
MMVATVSPISTHPRRCLRPLFVGDQGGRHQHRDTKISAMRQAAQETEQHHRRIGGRQAGQAIGQGKDQHQADQQGAPGQLGGQHRDQRRAQHHAQGIGADHMAGGGCADVKIAREIWEQTHAGEFGGADGKAAHGKREMHQVGMRFLRRGGRHTKLVRKQPGSTLRHRNGQCG